jgi:hypothetical protein
MTGQGEWESGVPQGAGGQRVCEREKVGEKKGKTARGKQARERERTRNVQDVMSEFLLHDGSAFRVNNVRGTLEAVASIFNVNAQNPPVPPPIVEFLHGSLLARPQRGHSVQLQDHQHKQFQQQGQTALVADATAGK